MILILGYYTALVFSDISWSFYLYAELLWWNPDWCDSIRRRGSIIIHLEQSYILSRTRFVLTLCKSGTPFPIHRNDMNSGMTKWLLKLSVFVRYSRARRFQLHLDTIQIWLFMFFFLRTFAALHRFTSSIYHHKHIMIRMRVLKNQQ